MINSLKNILNTFKKEKFGKKSNPKPSVAPVFKVCSNFDFLTLSPIASISEEVYSILDRNFVNNEKGYSIDWKTFVEKFYSEEKANKLSNIISSFLTTTVETDFDNLNYGEGLLDFNDHNEEGIELLSYFPRIDFHSRFKVEVTIFGFNELDINVFLLEKEKIFNITDKLKSQGLIMNLSSANSKQQKLIGIPYWIYQVFDSYLNQKDFWNFSNKALLSSLQSIQEWLLENDSLDSFVLNDIRLSGKKVIYLNSFDLFASRSLESGEKENFASLIPSCLELEEALGYENQEDLLNSIQRSIRNWNVSENILDIQTHNNEIVSLALSKKSQQAMKLLKEEFFNKDSTAIIEALRYHSDLSILKQYPEFVRVFNLDVNHYGRRVIGIGEPIIIPGQFGGNQFKSLLGDIDELEKQEDISELKLDQINGKDVIALKFPDMQYGEVTLHAYTEDLEQIKSDIKAAHNTNTLFSIKDQKTGKNINLDLSTKDSFNFVDRKLKEAIVKSKDPHIYNSKEASSKIKDEIKALQIDTSHSNLLYEEMSNIKEEQSLFSLDITSLGLKSDKSLFDYQEQCVGWLARCFLNNYSGVLLADDMGLGKTLQAMCFIRLLRNDLWNKRFDNAFEPVLIIVPPILLDNFEEQAKEFFDKPTDFDFSVLHGKTIKDFYRSDLEIKGKEIKTGKSFLDDEKLRSKGCIITTYETLCMYEHSFAKIPWSLLLCDEVQKAKSINTNISRVLKAVASKSNFKILMSGTPIENSMYEFWNIVDTCTPGLLGALVDFKREYKSFFKEASEKEKQEDFRTLLKRIQFGDFEKGFVNGRLKEEVGKNLPEKIEEDISFDLEVETIEAIKKIKKSSDKAISKVRQIKQVSIHKFLLNPCGEQSRKNWFENNNRLSKLQKLISSIKSRNEKILIFCEFHPYQAFVQNFINHEYGFDYKPINSLLDEVQKKSILGKFQKNSGFGALVLSPRCAGMGLNLQEANHVIHLTRWWNPAVEDQATCRAYRTGQKKNVHIYYFVANHFFEEALNERLKEKRKMRKNLFDLDYTQDISGLDLLNDDNLLEGSFKSLYQMDHIEANNTREQGSIFEQDIKSLYEHLGFNVRKPKDIGLDFIFIDQNENEIGVQVKHVNGGGEYNGYNSIKGFERSLKQYNLQKGLFITNGSYKSSHLQLLNQISNEFDIEWIDRRDLSKLIDQVTSNASS